MFNWESCKAGGASGGSQPGSNPTSRMGSSSALQPMVQSRPSQGQMMMSPVTGIILQPNPPPQLSPPQTSFDYSQAPPNMTIAGPSHSAMQGAYSSVPFPVYEPQTPRHGSNTLGYAIGPPGYGTYMPGYDVAPAGYQTTAPSYVMEQPTHGATYPGYYYASVPAGIPSNAPYDSSAPGYFHATPGMGPPGYGLNIPAPGFATPECKYQTFGHRTSSNADPYAAPFSHGPVLAAYGSAPPGYVSYQYVQGNVLPTSGNAHPPGSFMGPILTAPATHQRISTGSTGSTRYTTPPTAHLTSAPAPPLPPPPPAEETSSLTEDKDETVAEPVSFNT